MEKSKYCVRPFGSDFGVVDCKTIKEARTQLKSAKNIWKNFEWHIYENVDDCQIMVE